ncbi:MAG: Ig-like domain-containing protein [Chitinophagaceae bacterium]|nr:Ig-like domain-containing protein [Chitinophagaceae bacterium]
MTFKKSSGYVVILLLLISFSCKKNDGGPAVTGTLQLSTISIGTSLLNVSSGATNDQVPVDQPIVATFSTVIDTASVKNAVNLTAAGIGIPLKFSFPDGKTLSAKPLTVLENNTTYEFQITTNLEGVQNETFSGVTVNFTTIQGSLKIISFTVSGKDLLTADRVTDVDRNFPAIVTFDHPLDPASLDQYTVRVYNGGEYANISYTLSDSNKKISVVANEPLIHYEKYFVTLSSQIKGANGFLFGGYTKAFYSALDTTPKFPVISDDALLTLVEEQTFKYFWDYANPTSGLALERESSGYLVTTGGSGFGVMAILVGINRNFISRQEGVDRLEKIVNFLTDADRFHGAWPHWMNGSTGDVIPFSSNDNGADLVETSFMMQGLLTVRQFLNAGNSQENALIAKINNLWNTVEWDWFTKGGQNVLYWHWSPDKGWIMNMQIKGYDEALITYLLAAGSPTHTIDAAVYHNGWASNGGIINGNSYYGFPLPLGGAFGGPLFFAHYSFLGFNPHNLQDDYANYWEQNVNHTQINRAYCIDNPKEYVGYGSNCWGLTASDNQSGYSAHSPTNDLGVISPTAALSSFPYTPESSMEALKFFYYTLGDKLWGPYGFYDAFNVTEGWYGTSALAIDEGPIIVMMENYRTGLLWDLFMSSPEVDVAMNKLGFTN